MSSHEPESDEEDTGPVHLGRQSSSPSGRADRRYDAVVSVNPRPVARDRRSVVVVAAASAAVIVLGVLAWLFWPASDDSGSPATGSSATQTDSQQQAQARLMNLLPQGYSGDACERVVPAKDALAQMSCAANNDPGGPLSATYTLAKDSGSLKELFDDVVSTTAVVDCPGNIQSPGPWRRNATPEKSAGTLVCGFQQSKPSVGWTTEEDLLLSEVQSGPQGPNMVALYSWWASHS